MENDEFTLAKDSSVTTSPTSGKEKGDSSGKRPKSTHACDLCKRKKVKCNGEYPCTRCQKSGLYCTFNQHKQKRTSSKLYVNTQEQRIQALEMALNSLDVEPIVQPSENHHTVLTNDVTNQTFMAPIEKFNTNSTGRPSYARDWTARLDRLPSTFSMMTFLDNEPRKPDAFALPDTTVNLNLLSTYFDHVQPYFPMIHKESFLLGVHEQSPLLLNAMYAVADQWVHIDLRASDTGTGSSDSAQTTPHLPPGLKYYQDAISLVELYTDAPRLSTIQALLLIVKYHELVQRSGFFYRTRFYFDLVVRMCKDLGLSRMLPPTCQVHPILAEQRRRVFWIAYVYDLLMSTELGTPPKFSMDECSVELPSLLEDERNSREQHDTILYFHWMTMVTKAQGAVVHYLRQKYNDESSRKQQNMGGHLHSLRQHMEALGRELQLWRKPARGRVNFLFLAYHFANILLYRSMALDIMNGGIYRNQQMDMEQDYIKSFLLNEASAIADIVNMLLKDHTVTCFHYSFRGIQQIIHYLTAAWTVQLMYQQTDNDDRVKRMIQQLTPLTPAVELYSTEQQQSLQPMTCHQHSPIYAQQRTTKDPSISAAIALTTTQSSKMEPAKKEKSQKRSVKLQQQHQPISSPSSSSSSSTSISSSSSSPSPSQPHLYSRSGVHQKTLAVNGSESEKAQHINDPLFINTIPPSSLWQQQQQPQRQNWTQQNIESQYVSPSQLSSSPVPISTSESISTTYTRDPHPPPIMNASTMALLYQFSSSSSSSEPMLPTPSLGSLSSTSSSSTIASTPVDIALAHGSLRLRRSHQQLRNTSYRLLSSDLRSSGSALLHHPYSSSNPASTLAVQQQQQQQQKDTSPRRQTVSSSESSPSTSSLPSSPLHRMTLMDDLWIQAPPVILSSQHQNDHHHSTTALPPAPPSSSSSPSSSPSSFNLLCEEESMMGLLLPAAHLDWNHQVTTTLSTPAAPTSARSSPVPSS